MNEAPTQESPLDRALSLVKYAPLAKRLGKSRQAIEKWRANGRLPYTELSSETRYSAVIEEMTGGRVTQTELLDWSFPGRLREPAAVPPPERRAS